MLHINKYPVWPDGTRKKQSGFGPLSGTLIEKYDAQYALNPADLVGGAVWGVPSFLWKDGDGTTPTIGPASTSLVEVGAGALIPGRPMPYQYPNGVDATGEQYDGVNYRRDTVRRLSPTDTNDIVCAVKLRAPDPSGGAGTTDTFFSTATYNSSGDGIGMIQQNGAFRFFFQRRTVFSTRDVQVGDCFPRTPNIALAVVDRSARSMTGFINGVVGGTDAALQAGSLIGTGIAIGAEVDGTIKARAYTRIEWIAVWFGDGIYDTWRADSDRLIKRLSMESLGLRETVTNSKYWFYSRSGGDSGNNGGTSYIDHNGNWFFGSKYAPRAGNPNGCIVSPYQNNVIMASGGQYNYDIVAGTLAFWSSTGGVLTRVDDSAALLAAKAETWGPYVFNYANTTGAPKAVFCAPKVANTPYTFYLLARYVSGANAQIGWYDTTTTTFTSVGTILDGYALTRVLTQTRPSADCYFAIQIPDGCELRFIGQGLNGSVSGYRIDSYPTPYREPPWSTETLRERLITEHTPVAGSGSYLVNLAPNCWSGTELSADNTVLPCVTTAGDILHAEKAAPGWATSDGTVQIAAGAPVAGVYVNVWSAWKAALQYIQEGLVGVATTGAYDGTKGTAGALMVAPSIYGGEYAVKYLEIRDVS